MLLLLLLLLLLSWLSRCTLNSQSLPLSIARNPRALTLQATTTLYATPNLWLYTQERLASMAYEWNKEECVSGVVA